MTKPRHLIRMPDNVVPRGVGHDQSASYVGVSPNKFDELMRTGRMPQAKMAGGVKVWDIRALDKAFDELPSVGPANEDNEWEPIV